MDSKWIVFRETGIVAIGVALCTTLMVGIFALLGLCDTAVLLGGSVGAVLAIGNFFFMAVGTSLAADRAENQDVNGGKRLIRNSFALRLVVLFVILYGCAKSGVFDLFALVLPLAFVRPSMTIGEFFRRKGDA